MDFALSKSEIRLLLEIARAPKTIADASKNLSWPLSQTYVAAKKLAEKCFIEQTKRHQPLRLTQSEHSFAFQKLSRQYEPKALELLSGSAIEILSILTLKMSNDDADAIREWTGLSFPTIYKCLNPLNELGWVKKTKVFGAKNDAAYSLENKDVEELVDGLQRLISGKIYSWQNAGGSIGMGNRILFFSEGNQEATPTGLNALRKLGYIDYQGDIGEYIESIGKKRKLNLTLEDYIIHALVLSSFYPSTQKNATYIAWLLANPSKNLPGLTKKKPLKISWNILQKKAVQYGVGEKLEGIRAALTIIEGENKL